VFHIRNTRAFWRGGCFIYGTPQASWRGEVFHIRNTRIFRRGHRVSPAKCPGPERQTAAGSATTPIPPCAPGGFPTGSLSASSGAFPRGLPRLILGFPRGSFPRRRTRRAHGIHPDKTSAFPGVCPPAFQPPGHPGDPPRSGRGFSRPSPRALPGKRMGRAWGDGGSGGEDGR